MEKNKEFTNRCPCCNKVSPHDLIYEQQKDDLGEIDPGYFENFYFFVIVAVCQTCKSIWIASSISGIYEGMSALPGTKILYPAQGLPEEVPFEIRSSYYEATKVKDVSPQAFAVLIRRSLEFLYKDKGAKGKDLHQMLVDLREKNIIPAELFNLAKAVKDFGNLTAHANEGKATNFDAELINDLFLALVEFVYVAPSKLGQLQKRLGKQD